MQSKLKKIHSPDIDLANYWPEDDTNFGFLLEASIGPRDSDGADIFQFMVCSPDWIKKTKHASKLVWGQHMLIAIEYDLPAILTELERRIEMTTGSDWGTIARKLNKIAQWEFDEYQT
jgi:hypothetical protein